jgi:hypothetical protein
VDFPSWKKIFCTGSDSRDGMSIGRICTSSCSWATLADRFADRTDENVAIASTSVPPAVASDATVSMLTTHSRLRQAVTG